MGTSEIFDKYFNGAKNFFTNHTYGFGRIKFDEELLFYEKSQGKGLFGSQLYGVTFLIGNSETGEVQRIDLSKCFSSKEEVENYIATINLEVFENADRYGEIKKIF